MKTLCGLDCSKCELKDECSGCTESDGTHLVVLA